MNITLENINKYTMQGFAATKKVVQDLYTNVSTLQHTLPQAYQKINQDDVIRNVAATVLGVLGLAAFASGLPIVGSLVLFVPAMASPFSGIFPFAYATGAIILSYKLFQVPPKR